METEDKIQTRRSQGPQCRYPTVSARKTLFGDAPVSKLVCLWISKDLDGEERGDVVVDFRGSLRVSASEKKRVSGMKNVVEVEVEVYCFRVLLFLY